MWRPESVYDGKGHLDEGVIHAWLDGALERDAAREVEAHAEACVTCSARVSEARGLVAGASRVLGALDGAPGVARGVAPDSARGVVGDSTPRVVRGKSAVDAGKSSHGRQHRWWATRTMGLAAAAVFIFAAGSVVLRDQLGGGGGVREAIMADPSPGPARAAVASESGFPAAPPTVGDAGVAASAPTVGEVSGPVRSPVQDQPGAEASAPAEPRGDPAAPPPPMAAPLAPAPAADFKTRPATDPAGESARRREVASISAANAPRMSARAPAATVHLRGQVAGADSATRSDSAIPHLGQDHPMQAQTLRASVGGLAEMSNDVTWIAPCWRRADSDTLYRFADPDSADRPTTRGGAGAKAFDRDRPDWMTGDRIVAGSVVGTFQWVAERDSSGVRIRTPGGELRLRAAGDSLLEGRTGAGQRVRFEALSGCP